MHLVIMLVRTGPKIYEYDVISNVMTLREGSTLPFWGPFYDYFSYIRSYLGAYTKKTSPWTPFFFHFKLNTNT